MLYHFYTTYNIFVAVHRVHVILYIFEIVVCMTIKSSCGIIIWIGYTMAFSHSSTLNNI